MHSAELGALTCGDVGDDQARRPTGVGIGREPLPAVGLEERRVRHRNDRRVADERPRLGEAVEAPRGAHAASERSLRGPLDHGSVGEGVGEREAQLDHVRARVDGGASELRCLRLADEVDHQRLSHGTSAGRERGQRLREILVAATREADGDVVGVEALDDCERVRRLERGNDALGA